MAKKINKLRGFWKSYFGSIIDKGARKEVDRLNRNYESHRAKSATENQGEKPEQQPTNMWRTLCKLLS